MAENEVKPPEGKKFYGSVTVGERGQIVVPAEARKDFDIGAGDKLLVFGDLAGGLWIATLPIIQKYIAGSEHFVGMLQSTMNTDKGTRSKKRHSRKNPSREEQ